LFPDGLTSGWGASFDGGAVRGVSIPFQNGYSPDGTESQRLSNNYGEGFTTPGISLSLVYTTPPLWSWAEVLSFILPVGPAPLFSQTYNSATPKTVGPLNPNPLPAPGGSGRANFARGDALLPYCVEFETAASPTAPAQRVDATNQLDARLDRDTFAFT